MLLSTVVDLLPKAITGIFVEVQLAPAAVESSFVCVRRSSLALMGSPVRSDGVVPLSPSLHRL